MLVPVGLQRPHGACHIADMHLHACNERCLFSGAHACMGWWVLHAVNVCMQVPDESLERWPEAGAAANIGIMLFRNKSIAFVDKWIEVSIV